MMGLQSLSLLPLATRAEARSSRIPALGGRPPRSASVPAHLAAKTASISPSPSVRLPFIILEWG